VQTQTKAQTRTYQSALEASIARFDARALAKTYQEQGELIVIDDFLDEAALAPSPPRARRARGRGAAQVGAGLQERR